MVYKSECSSGSEKMYLDFYLLCDIKWFKKKLDEKED